MTAKQCTKIEQTHPACLHAVEKYEKVESINTQTDYKTTSKKMNRWKKTNLCLKVFKLQDNKFKIVQKNFQKILIKSSWKKRLVTMIITWKIWVVKGRRLVVIDCWRALICSAGSEFKSMWKKRYLGIYLDEYLNCSPHINHLGILGKGVDTPFSRSTPPYLRFPLSRNPRCPHVL